MRVVEACNSKSEIVLGLLKHVTQGKAREWRDSKQTIDEQATQRESKGTPAKAWVSKGNPEQAPESFARSLCSLASLAPRNNNTQKNQAQQATLNKNIPQQPEVTKNNKNN